MKKINFISAMTAWLIIGEASQAHAGYGALDGVMYFAIFFVVTIIIFLVCREIVCWYFKINEKLSVLLEIRDLLRTSQGNSTLFINESSSSSADITCEKCGKSYPENAAGSFCENCGMAFSK